LENILTSFIEELKASRTSMFELLKETQSMTNAVLSSQAVLIQLLTKESANISHNSQPSNIQEQEPIHAIQENTNTQDLQSSSTMTKDTTERLPKVSFLPNDDTFDDDDTTDSFITNTDDTSYLSSSPSISDDGQIPQRKKKKKKKKKNLQNSFDNVVSVQNQLSSNKNTLVSSDDFVVDNDAINQDISKDDFNDVSQDLSSFDIEVPSDSSDNFTSSTTFSDKDDDFVDLDHFSTDDLDFSLPDEVANNTTDTPNNSYSESTVNDLNYSSTSIDESQTNSASKDQDEIDFSSLDSLMSDPEDFPSSMGNSDSDNSVFSNNNDSNESEASLSLDDLTDSSVLPEIDNKDEQESITNSSTAPSEATNIPDFSSLDDLLGNGISKLSSSEQSTDLESTPTEMKQPKPSVSRYQAELDKIRDALTSDNVDISSLDSPITLDDYSDDENIHEDDTVTQSPAGSSSPNTKSDDDWEWEYVEDDGNSQDSDDWEWEYVEDDSSDTNIDNKQQ
jgi:hypothetical protein